jgi:CRISPR/Cas system type I-B associated protein Csh2 (Cas7 group RAMP superfamily)
LIVRSLNGRSEVAGAWDAWQKGPVSIPASASWLPSDIASLQVTTSAKSLVTMSTSHQAAEGSQ